VWYRKRVTHCEPFAAASFCFHTAVSSVVVVGFDVLASYIGFCFCLLLRSSSFTLARWTTLFVLYVLYVLSVRYFVLFCYDEDDRCVSVCVWEGSVFACFALDAERLVFVTCWGPVCCPLHVWFVCFVCVLLFGFSSRNVGVQVVRQRCGRFWTSPVRSLLCRLWDRGSVLCDACNICDHGQHRCTQKPDCFFFLFVILSRDLCLFLFISFYFYFFFVCTLDLRPGERRIETVKFGQKFTFAKQISGDPPR
jgi:hypothetical protein